MRSVQPRSQGIFPLGVELGVGRQKAHPQLRDKALGTTLRCVALPFSPKEKAGVTLTILK